MSNFLFGILLVPLFILLWLLVFMSVNDRMVEYQECGFQYCAPGEK